MYGGSLRWARKGKDMCDPDWAFPNNTDNYRVFFAGEQASYMHGWIQGAMAAGLRCVQQVCEAWKLRLKETTPTERAAGTDAIM
ncbi:hypothetical protein MAPG_10716 [Magnaporthiopsis poae ATCC 64411]|uniref:Amine oxidase domain-containing protein n=1 Tax=Magnaporthiopsis poae (strain ATCC 64411 / 73-15) TaxID=644358 RepID=A0A0C4EDC1_MAGP6|nr:hypothetical protein MAPG_10716 [Magnaporthiopsis poae ATCC 64411]